jgi:hypothetical protein
MTKPTFRNDDMVMLWRVGDVCVGCHKENTLTKFMQGKTTNGKKDW